MDLLGNTVSRHVEDKTLDIHSPEFLQARAERIEFRRKRIAAKIAKEKGVELSETTSAPSSLEFLATLGDVPISTHGGGRTKTRERERDGKSKSHSKMAAATTTVSISSRGQGDGDGFHTHTQSHSGSKSTSSGLVDYSDAPLDNQMTESRKQLEQIILDGETLITNVKVAAEYREKTRQVRVEETKKERLERLDKEAEESQKMYESINEHWMASAEKLLPMELYAKIQEQQKACDNLLEKQDEEIYNLRKELEDNDIEYENLLEIYQKDIMLMGDRIDDNIDVLRSAFMEELELIEAYTVKDREQLLEENQKEWMKMLKEYEDLEKRSLEERKNDALSKFERLTDLYANVKQEARLLKNQMQNDMRTLFCEREQIKCAIQMNLEKLDYNLAVLRKREEENMKMKNSMKRLLLKLQDRFNEKARILRDKVGGGKKESAKLIKEIRRLESLCDDAKRKTLHMYASDYHKFLELWMMNEEECREKLCRLLGSERFIVEEQLGTGFVQPDLSSLDERPYQVQCYLDTAIACGCDDEEEEQTGPDSFRSQSITRRETKSVVDFQGKSVFFDDDEATTGKEKLDKKLDTKTSRTSLYLDPTSDFDFLPGPDPDPVIQRRLMKHITKVVCDQTGFFLEDKMRKIMMPMLDSEKQLIHIDTVLQALGVTHIDEMQILARYLLKYSSIMKGIISRSGMKEPDVDHMKVSDSGITDVKRKSKSKGTQKVCEPPLEEMCEDKINQLKEQNRLSSSSSELSPSDFEGDGNGAGGRMKEIMELDSVPSSALQILSETALESVRGIQEVHAIPPSETNLGPVSVPVPIPFDAKKAQFQETTETPQLDPTPSVLEIIQEFSSDESLANVLEQVEKRGKKATTKGMETTGEGEGGEKRKKKMKDASSSSSCSCDTYQGSSDSTLTEKCESCGGSVHGDDPFDSNKATVLSWVTEVAAGLTSDCHDRQEYMGEDDGMYIEEIGEDGCVGPRLQTYVRPDSGNGGQNDPGQGRGQSHDRDSSATPSEFLGEHEFKKIPTPIRSSCGPSDQSGMSIVSLESGVDSTEFFYIEPNDVLRAIAAFCRDHNAKIKTELPTKSELYEARIAKICFPPKEEIKEYWDKFLVLLDPKSKQLWEGIQEVFIEYDDNLRMRNKFVEDIVRLYRQNYELSHLLKKQIQIQNQTCAAKGQVGPFSMPNLPYCGVPCSNPQVGKSSSATPKYSRCPPLFQKPPPTPQQPNLQEPTTTQQMIHMAQEVNE